MLGALEVPFSCIRVQSALAHLQHLSRCLLASAGPMCGVPASQQTWTRFLQVPLLRIRMFHFSRHVLEKMCVMQVPLQFSQGECKIVFWTMHVFVADSQYGTNRSTGGFSTRLWLDRCQFSLNGRFPEVLACVTWDPDRLEELSTAATVRA